jgi:hypothetical protein
MNDKSKASLFCDREIPEVARQLDEGRMHFTFVCIFPRR